MMMMTKSWSDWEEPQRDGLSAEGRRRRRLVDLGDDDGALRRRWRLHSTGLVEYPARVGLLSGSASPVVQEGSGSGQEQDERASGRAAAYCRSVRAAAAAAAAGTTGARTVGSIIARGERLGRRPRWSR